MRLDFNLASGYFWLALPRGEGEPTDIMAEYGLDYSATASTADQAILMTRQPYAAAAFAEVATPGARERLGWILHEVERSRAATAGRHITVPADKELWPYQVASLDYALDRPNTLIASEPGLGKTMQAIAFANEIQAERVLVVCPASIRLQWLKRIDEWSTMKREAPWAYIVLKAKNGVSASAHWTIISYELARSPGILAALLKQSFDLLIIDEVHYAKTHDAARSRAIFGRYDAERTSTSERPVSLVECAQRVLALSGTPLPNRAAEIYGVARALCWDSIGWMSQDKFADRFNPRKVHSGERADGSPYRWVEEYEGRLPELQTRLRAHFMTRHLKKDVLGQLKMPVYDLVQVEETKAVKLALAHERLLDIDVDLLTGANMEFDGQVATVRREMGEALAPQVAQYVEMLYDGGEEKLVVFAWHVSVLDILERALHKLGIVRVDGSDSARNKDRKIREFIESPQIGVILGNTLTLGTGVDGLQHVASHVLIAEPDWMPGNNVQMVDRLHRGGQRNTVLADLFVAPGSIAERILAAALHKGLSIEKSLDSRVLLPAW